MTWDDNAPQYIVKTDASGTGLADVLLQNKEGYEHMQCSILYFSEIVKSRV